VRNNRAVRETREQNGIWPFVNRFALRPGVKEKKVARLTTNAANVRRREDNVGGIFARNSGRRYAMMPNPSDRGGQ